MIRISTSWLTQSRAIIHRNPTWLGRLFGYSERHDEVLRIRAPVPGGFVWITSETGRVVPEWLGDRLDREHTLLTMHARKAAIERRV